MIFLDQVGDDFGVGFGRELMAFGNQLLFQREIVLDDAVVDDDDFSGAIAVRVGVFFSGAAVGGPAGMADTVGAVERLDADDLFKIAELALGAAHLQTLAIARHSDARRVIAAIFKLAQALDDDLDDRLSCLHIPRCRTLANCLLGERVEAVIGGSTLTIWRRR